MTYGGTATETSSGLSSSAHSDSPLVVSTDGSALGNRNAEPSQGKTSGLPLGEVSDPHGSRRAHSDSPLVVSTDGSALGNRNAEPSQGKTSGLPLGEVSDPNGSRRAHSDSPLVVSTDGSALGNPNGPMGWGWVDHRGGRHDAGGASNGTNQIGELCAVLQALRAHPGPQDLIIESDSQYAINCSTKWIHGWKKNGWKNAKKQSVKNAPLIKAIDAELSGRSGTVKFKWVKGHAGNEFNEKVDDLAHGYATHIGEGKETGYLPIEGWQSLLESPYATGADIPDDVKLILAGKAPHSASDAVNHPTGVANKLSSEETVGSDHDAPMPNGLSERSTLPTSSDTETQASPHSEATPSEPAPRDDHDDASLPHVNALAAQSPAETETSGLGKHSAPNPEQTTVSSGNRRKPRLHASGRIRLTPPPSSNGRYADASLHVSGTLHVDARIDNDGYVDLEDAVFTMDWFSTNGQQNA